MAGRLLRPAGALRGSEVPDGSTQHAVFDELDSPLRHSLEVDPLRQAARVERVVCDRHLLVERAVADAAGQVAAVLEHGEAAERVEGEVLEQLAERVRLEHGAVGARLELPRPAGPRRFLPRLQGNRGGVDVGHTPGRLLGVARRTVAGGERHRRRIGRRVLGGDSGRRRDCHRDAAAREEPVDRQLGRVDRGGGEPCLLVRADVGRRSVVALRLRQLGRLRDGCRVRVLRRGVGGCLGPGGEEP